MSSPYYETSAFFDLPLAIRNKIYRLVLVKRGRPIRLRRVPSLLQVNRQIREEAFPIRYGENKFYIIQDPDVDIALGDPMLRMLAESGCFAHISSFTLRCMSHWSRKPHLDFILLNKPSPSQQEQYLNLRIGSDDTDWTNLAVTVVALAERGMDIMSRSEEPWKQRVSAFRRGAGVLLSIIALGYVDMSNKWLVMDFRTPGKRN